MTNQFLNSKVRRLTAFDPVQLTRLTKMLNLKKDCQGQKKINYIFLRHRRHHFNPPAPKFFMQIPVIYVKICQNNANYQFNQAAIFLFRPLFPCLCMVGRLTEYWCTHSRDSGPVTKC